MELDLGPEIEQFRHELRGWMAEHAPPVLAGLIDWRMAAVPGGYRTPGLTKALRHPAHVQWEQALKDARLICPQQLAQAYTSVQLMRFSGLRTLARALGLPKGST